MNKLAVVCLLVTCAVVCQAVIPRTRYHGTGSIRYCRDYRGQLVRPGRPFYDGCNRCTCGINGTPSYCTQRFCGNDHFGTGGVVRPIGGLGHHGGLGAIGGIGVIGGIGGIGGIRGGRIGGLVNPLRY